MIFRQYHFAVMRLPCAALNLARRLWREQPEMAQAFNRALSLKRVRIEHLVARLKPLKVVQGLFPYSPALLGPVMRLLALAHNLNREGTTLLPTG